MRIYLFFLTFFYPLCAQDISTLQEMCIKTIVDHGVIVSPEMPVYYYFNQIKPAFDRRKEESRNALERIVLHPGVIRPGRFTREEQVIFYPGGPWDTDCKMASYRRIASLLYTCDSEYRCRATCFLVGVACSISGLAMVMLPSDLPLNGILQSVGATSLIVFGFGLSCSAVSCIDVSCIDFDYICRCILKRAADPTKYSAEEILLPQTTRDIYEAYQKQQLLEIKTDSDDDTSSGIEDETTLLIE